MFFLCLSLTGSSSDEDDTAELLRELQKIKKERAEEEARKVRVKVKYSCVNPFSGACLVCGCSAR